MKRARAVVWRCWSSRFPEDLLAVVYHMVASSPRDRVRFAAVCRSWRAAARMAPYPRSGAPWLLLPPFGRSRIKRLHCPEDGALVRVNLPSRRQLGGGCYDGGWVISFSPDQIKIVNLFSGAEVALPKYPIWWTNYYYLADESMKFVFSNSPTSDDCILAAMTTDRPGIGLCRVGRPGSAWKVQSSSRLKLEDIAFCNGELYGLRKTQYNLGRVVHFEIGENKEGEPRVTAENLLAMESIEHPIPYSVSMDPSASHIFDLHGKLAIAIMKRWAQDEEPFFKVFELVDIIHGDGEATRYKQKWVEVTSLGDHALFLGRVCSKAVRVPADKHGHVERNCVYYYRNLYSSEVVPSDVVFSTFSNGRGHQLYRRTDDGENNNTTVDDVKMIKSAGYFKKNSVYNSMWILPPHV